MPSGSTRSVFKTLLCRRRTLFPCSRQQQWRIAAGRRFLVTTPHVHPVHGSTLFPRLFFRFSSQHGGNAPAGSQHRRCSPLANLSWLHHDPAPGRDVRVLAPGLRVAMPLCIRPVSSVSGSLASCQRKDLAIPLYFDRSSKFACKARWWAAPVGDPNAGKSPAYSLVSNAFEELVHSHQHLFGSVDHFIGVGNNGKIQERLRKHASVFLLLWGPEAKPILDLQYPTRETVDVSKYIDLGRSLEAASGGKFEWGTGTEEKGVKPGSTGHALPTPRVQPYQRQYLLVPGFRARILLKATGRTLVTKKLIYLTARLSRAQCSAYGRKLPQPGALLRSCPVTCCEPRCRPKDLEEKGGLEFAASREQASVLSDNALKCGVRHFDLHVVRSCAVVDAEIRHKYYSMEHSAGSRRDAIPPLQRERTPVQRLLSVCAIPSPCMTDVSKHISALKGAAKYDERLQLLQLQSGELKHTRRPRRRPNSEDGACAVEFHRWPLTSAIESTLAQMQVPVSL